MFRTFWGTLPVLFTTIWGDEPSVNGRYNFAQKSSNFISFLSVSMIPSPQKKTHILLMEEILHQLTGSLSDYLQGLIHPRWLAVFLPSTVAGNIKSSVSTKNIWWIIGMVTFWLASGHKKRASAATPLLVRPSFCCSFAHHEKHQPVTHVQSWYTPGIN